MFKTAQTVENEGKSESVGYFRTYMEDNENINNFDKDLTQKKTRRKRNNIRKNKVKNYTENLKRRLFKCRSCMSTFQTKQLLLKHVDLHIGTPISCRKCKKSFNSRLAFLSHSTLRMCKTKPVVIKYHCDQCPKFFRFKRHIERHLEGHKRNSCTYCDIKLTRRKHLVEHLQAVHSIKLERAVLYRCSYCEKRYTKKRSLYCHLKQHADNKIVCMECGFMSDTQEEHNIHYVGHDKDRPWQCEKCQEKFSRRQQYLVHIKRHERYKCLTCNESHASKVQILRHKQRGHTVQGLEPQLKCPHCPNAFHRRLALQIHLRKHTEDKPMHCKYCDKSFRSPYLYFKHCASTIHEIHSPEKKQLVCDICGILFMKKYQLEQHLQRVHNQNKQFSCEFCKYKTNSRRNMARHMALHLENKKECICEQCGKAFYNLTTLKDHMSYVHSQERHFKCNICDKAFKRNSELVRHQTCHSAVRPHVCKTCGVSYKRSTHLRRHEETRHGTTSSNGRVQRLKKDETGALVPINEEKKAKPKSYKKKPKNDTKQVFSIVDTRLGEMMTFTIPQVNSSKTLASVLNIKNEQYTQNLVQTVTIPYSEIWTDKIDTKSNMVLNNTSNIILTNDVNSSNLNVVNSNFPSQFTNEANFSPNQPNLSNILQEAIENSTTCDILLPTNANLNDNVQQNTENFLENSYQFL